MDSRLRLHLDSTTKDRLDAYAKATGVSVSAAAEELILFSLDVLTKEENQGRIETFLGRAIAESIATQMRAGMALLSRHIDMTMTSYLDEWREEREGLLDMEVTPEDLAGEYTDDLF